MSTNFDHCDKGLLGRCPDVSQVRCAEPELFRVNQDVSHGRPSEAARGRRGEVALQLSSHLDA
jgi:hypothetical protein